MANVGWEDILEFVGTSGFTLGFDRLLRGELGTNLKKGFDDLKTKIEERAKQQVVMWSYVRNLDMEYSDPLVKIHRDARAHHQFMRANRIETIYTLVYMTFDDVTLDPSKDERDQMRERAFQELARAAKNNPVEFDDLMDAYERQGFRTYLLIAKHFGLDAWQYIGAPLTAIAEAIGGEGAVEKLKIYFQNPERWGPDLLRYRNESPLHESIRSWMTQEAERLRILNEESRTRAAETPRWRIPGFVLWPIVFTGTVIFLSIIIGYTQK